MVKRQESRHFNEKHRKRLADIFARLADFINENKLKQVVGIGPSAYPYTLAVRRAYQRRYGRRLGVVNFGEVGEKLGELNPRWNAMDSEKASELLQRNRRNVLVSKKKSLLFDETISSGQSVYLASDIFKYFGIPHKTAALLALRGDPLFQPDFVGRYMNTEVDPLVSQVYFKRGKAHGLDIIPRQRTRPLGSWAAFMRQIHNELKEIANRVPKKK